MHVKIKNNKQVGIELPTLKSDFLTNNYTNIATDTSDLRVFHILPITFKMGISIAPKCVNTQCNESD